jgi:hypothetical protein
MSILLEGADNSGKTTLGKELLQLNAHLEYFHSGSAPLNEEHENLCLQQQFAMCAKPQMIIDRATCISQQVYKDGRLHENKLLMEVDKLLQIGTLIVYCRPSTDKLMSFEKFTWRSEESETYKQHVIANQHKYIERYDQVMHKIPHLLYDYEDELSSGWLRKMLSEVSSSPITYQRLIDVTLRRVG